MKTTLQRIGKDRGVYPIIVTAWLVMAFRIMALEPQAATGSKDLPDKIAGVPVTWAAKPAWPMEQLPKQVPAPPGALSLFADFEDKHGDAIVLYLVNRTGSALSLPSQDGYLAMMLERQLSNGRWERVGSYVSSFCGNSYYGVMLPADHFFRFLGGNPSKGDPAVVRYAGFGVSGVISNSAPGLVSEEMVEAARTDKEAQRRVLRSFVDTLRDTNVDLFGRQLRPIPPSRIVAAMELLRGFDQAWWFRRNVAKWVQTHEKSTDPEINRACSVIRQQLDQAWPSFEDYPALFERCAAALTNPDENLSYGSPESERPLVWAVLTELASRQIDANVYGFPPLQPFPEERRKQVAEEAVRVALHGPDEEREEVGRLLLNDAFQNAALTDDFWEKMFLNPSEQVWRPAAQALQRRNQRERLFELALQHNAETQSAILWATMTRPRDDAPPVPLEMGNRELQFWDAQWVNSPKEAIRSLISLCGYTDMRPAPLAFRQRILDCLDDATRNAGNIPVKCVQGEVEMTVRLALAILDAWKVPDDTVILQKQLYNPWYVETTTHSFISREDRYRDVITRRYPVRQAAKELLEKRGVKVPADLVVERELPATGESENLKIFPPSK